MMQLWTKLHLMPEPLGQAAVPPGAIITLATHMPIHMLGCALTPRHACLH